MVECLQSEVTGGGETPAIGIGHTPHTLATRARHQADATRGQWAVQGYYWDLQTEPDTRADATQ